MKTKQAKPAKSAKPATEAQKLARERNWNKRLISGMYSSVFKLRNTKTIKQPEKIILTEIIYNLARLLHDWEAEK